MAQALAVNDFERKASPDASDPEIVASSPILAFSSVVKNSGTLGHKNIIFTFGTPQNHQRSSL
ncbi:MAG TPA: hypothetical protein VGF44_07860 [Terriglobales bacterium]|jgi:hypothetical protein